MSLGRTIIVGLCGAAALALWWPGLLGGGRGPALPGRPRVEPHVGAPARAGRAAPLSTGIGSSAERSGTLLALERLLPDGPRRSLADLARAPGASPDAPGAAPGVARDAWDHLALRWAQRVAPGREPAEDAR